MRENLFGVHSNMELSVLEKALYESPYSFDYDYEYGNYINSLLNVQYRRTAFYFAYHEACANKSKREIIKEKIKFHTFHTVFPKAERNITKNASFLKRAKRNII